jgi:hypothetical protein
MNGPLERVHALLAAEIEAIRAELAGRPVAVGWATVELERAAAELGAALAIGAERFEAAPDTTALGARCLIADEVLAGDLSLVLLEPSTEGRLAATLARFGEGPAAIWLAPVDPTVAGTTLGAAGRVIPAATAGPFGPERLLPGGSGYGPHRLLIEPAGTIRP